MIRPAVVLLLLLSAGVARAYVQAVTQTGGTPLHWIGVDCIRLRPDVSSARHVVGGSDLDALAQAVANWEGPTQSCSYVRLVVEAVTVLPAAPPRGKLRQDVAVFFIDQGWESISGSTAETVALTTLRYVDKPGDPKDGQILDADLDVNVQTFRFSMGGVAGTLNVEQTLTHELGHVLGLDHPCTIGTPGEMNVPSCSSGSFKPEVMYPTAQLGDSLPHKPAPDEALAICAIYPLAADPGRCDSSAGGGGGGCAVPGSRSASAAGAAACLLALLVMAVAMGRRRGV